MGHYINLKYYCYKAQHHVTDCLVTTIPIVLVAIIEQGFKVIVIFPFPLSVFILGGFTAESNIVKKGEVLLLVHTFSYHALFYFIIPYILLNRNRKSNQK